jgi:hypothetical protein
VAHCVGLLVGAARGFIHALETRLSAAPAIVCERVSVAAPGAVHISRYDALLDRASERVPHLAAFARCTALAGTTVVNDPRVLRDGFGALSVVARLGMTTARAALLPQKAYRSDVDCERALSNLVFPLPWHQVANYVGLPARLSDTQVADARLCEEGPPVRDVAELLAAYDGSGERVMMLRQQCEGSPVRVICVGERALALAEGAALLDGERADALCRQALELTRALGWAINAVDFAVRGDDETVIRAELPFISLEPEVLGEPAFEAVVGWTADLMVAAARTPFAGLFAQRQ